MTDQSIQATGTSNDQSLEMVKALWEEIKYRHELFWKLLFRALTGVLILLSIPILSADKLNISMATTPGMFMFPIAASAIAIFSFQVFTREHQILRPVIRLHDELLVRLLGVEASVYRNPNASKATYITVAFLTASLIGSALEIWMIFAGPRLC